MNLQRVVCQGQTSASRLPDAAAIVETLEYVRHRCPECEGEAPSLKSASISDSDRSVQDIGHRAAIDETRSIARILIAGSGKRLAFWGKCRLSSVAASNETAGQQTQIIQKRERP